MMRLWMKVSLDGLELPMAVAGSANELARMCGTSERAIRISLRRFKHGETKSCPYRDVFVEEGDE